VGLIPRHYGPFQNYIRDAERPLQRRLYEQLGDPNVFPELGRTCDRQCEPACPRGVSRKLGTQLAGLPRVAAIPWMTSSMMPAAVGEEGKVLSHRGGGPDSLTVSARPPRATLGYHCTVFDFRPEAGG